MKSIKLTHVLIGICMFASAALAVALKPTEFVRAERQDVDLEELLPREFGGWVMVDDASRLMVNPEIQSKLEKIYSQTLARTYQNSDGYKIMLSVAYGGDQSDRMQLHRPEACYPAQGFEILNKQKGDVDIAGKKIPVKRLLARQGGRVEPLTYWIIIGEEATRGDTDRKMARFIYGLTGKIPDGMLVRVSSIERDASRAFSIQDDFIRALSSAVGTDGYAHFFGKGRQR